MGGAQDPGREAIRRSAERTGPVFQRELRDRFSRGREALAKVKKEKDDLLKMIPNTMVMEEMAKPRDTFISCGKFQAKGEKVTASVPAFLPPLAPGLPSNRLGLARWLVSRNNPLPARVTVIGFGHVLWHRIVKTANDFGSQGDCPVTRSCWIGWPRNSWTKAGCETHHQTHGHVRGLSPSSAVTPKILERDPYNGSSAAARACASTPNSSRKRPRPLRIAQ